MQDRQARLPNANADARQRELNRILDQPAHERHAAPQRDRDRNDRATIAPIAPASGRKTQQGVKQGETETCNERHHRIGQHQVLLDRLERQADDLPIDGHHHVKRGEGDHRERRQCWSARRIRLGMARYFRLSGHCVWLSKSI